MLDGLGVLREGGESGVGRRGRRRRVEWKEGEGLGTYRNKIHNCIIEKDSFMVLCSNGLILHCLLPHGLMIFLSLILFHELMTLLFYGHIGYCLVVFWVYGVKYGNIRLWRHGST